MCHHDMHVHMHALFAKSQLVTASWPQNVFCSCCRFESLTRCDSLRFMVIPCCRLTQLTHQRVFTVLLAIHHLLHAPYALSLWLGLNPADKIVVLSQFANPARSYVHHTGYKPQGNTDCSQEAEAVQSGTFKVLHCNAEMDLHKKLLFRFERRSGSLLVVNALMQGLRVP